MKRLISFSILLAFVVLLSGCNSFQIQGLENFTESDCCFGLNDGLLPGGKEFLSQYPYQRGDYQYWRNDYGNAQAKTYIQMVYSKEIYEQAKQMCQEYFTFSEESFPYKAFTFYGVNVAGGDVTLLTAFPGVRMFGYNDEMCALVFIGYLDDSGKDSKVTASNFTQILEAQFGNWLGDKGTVLLSPLSGDRGTVLLSPLSLTTIDA